MAKSAGKKLSDMIVWVIIGLLMIGLAGFGIGNFSGGSSEVGRVGSEPITANEYARAIQAEIRNQANAGSPLTSVSALVAAGMDRAILDSLVARATLAHEANEMGLSVGDLAVAEQIRNTPSFAGLDGQFDREAYEFTIERAGFDVADYEETVRDDLIRSLLQVAVIGGLTPPDAYAEALVAYQTETRNFTMARVTEGDLSAGLAAPTDEELQTYYDDNGARFERPEQRVFSYAWITPDMIMDEIEIEEDLLRELYEERIAEYVQPERRLLERLVFPSLEEAEAARAALDAGETDYDTLIEERGLTLDDVDLGETAAGDLSDEAAEVIFADTESEILGPLESQFGPALFRINAVLSATEVTFEEAESDLSAELAEDRARRNIADMVEDLDDLLAGGATLEELPNETALVADQITWTPASEDGIAAYAAFGEAAEAAREGDFPEVLELSDGGLFALRLDEVIAPAIPPFEEIRDEVSVAWRASELRVRLEDRAQTLAGQLALSGNLDSLGLDLQEEVLIRRQDFIPDAPQTLVAQVFQLSEPGDLVVIPGALSAYIVRLDSINPGTRGAPDTAVLQGLVGAQLGQSIAGDIFEAYGQALQAEVGISIDPATINAIHAQFR